jgi:hypothetical protein
MCYSKHLLAQKSLIISLNQQAQEHSQHRGSILCHFCGSRLMQLEPVISRSGAIVQYLVVSWYTAQKDQWFSVLARNVGAHVPLSMHVRVALVTIQRPFDLPISPSAAVKHLQ